MNKLIASATVLFLIGALTLQAGTITLSGDTTGQLTWNRPLDGTPPPGLSTFAIAVPYEVWPFTVNVSDVHSLEIISASGWVDTFMVLYQTSFDPAQPLTNALSSNDDGGYILLSRIDYGLVAGRQYYMVVTGYDNLSYGPYTATISGPGDIILGTVPEPTTLLLLGAGLAGLGLLRRRRAERRA